MSRRSIALVATVLLFLAGCGGDDGESPFRADSAEDPGDGADQGSGGDDTSAESTDGSTSDGGDSGAGGATVDGDFPIAIADGVKDVLFEMGGQKQLAYPPGDLDRIVAFYTDWVDAQPGEWGRAEVANTVTWDPGGRRRAGPDHHRGRLRRGRRRRDHHLRRPRRQRGLARADD